MSMGFHRPYHLDLCADDEDPSQLIIRPGWDAPHVRCFPRTFCAWPCLLRQVGTVIGSPYDYVVARLACANPGSQQTWYQSRTVCRIIKPWSKSSLAFYSYIVTLGIREQRKASFLLTFIDLSSGSPLSFLRDDRTRLIYVLLEHLVECFLVAVGLLWLSRVSVF